MTLVQIILVIFSLHSVLPSTLNIQSFGRKSLRPSKANRSCKLKFKTFNNTVKFLEGDISAWPRDHKLRIFFSLPVKWYSKYLKLYYLIHCFDNLQICMNNLYIQAQYIKVLIDYQVIPVWNFDLGTFSVYGHGLCLKHVHFSIMSYLISKQWQVFDGTLNVCYRCYRSHGKELLNLHIKGIKRNDRYTWYR